MTAKLRYFTRAEWTLWGASVLLTVDGSTTITLNATENNTTLNSAGITVQKLD